MKFVKVLVSLALIVLSTFVMVETSSVLMGVATIPLLTYGFKAVTGLSLLSGEFAAYGALAPVKRPAQGQANPGGGRLLWLIGTDGFTAEWPKKGDITDGEITVAPTLSAAVVGPPAVAAATFVQVDVSDNSLKLDANMKGAVGYQSWDQAIEVKIAGYGKAQVAAIEKLLNQEVVAVVLTNDGQRIVVGTSLNGQQFEIMHTTGAKGGDRREWTLKSKQDGYMHGYLPLADSIILPGISS